jgi:hypothetical protein
LFIGLKSAVQRWLKSEAKAPAWDEIALVQPIIPEPPFTDRGGGVLGSWFAKRSVSNAKKGDRDYYNAVGECYDIGTKYTPKDPVEAMRWYNAAVDGDPIKATGPHYSKLRIAEMYEDGEGVTRDLETAGRIYKTLPHYPSAMLHFAIAHIEGRGVPQDYVEAYKLLLTADKFFSMHPPTRKQVQTDPQQRRRNHRHTKVRELIMMLETRLKPEQLIKARDKAREWWNANR